MDILPENPIDEKNKSRNVKRSLTIITILIVLLVIIGVVIFAFTIKLSNEKLKVKIDKTENVELQTNAKSIFFVENGKVYTSIRGISDYVGYRYYNGGYNQFSEEQTSCYVSNSKEIVSFDSGKNSFRKYPLLSNSESQLFEIDEDVTTRGNNLYISEQGLERAFNLDLTFNDKTNTIEILTLPFLSNFYETNFDNCSLEKSGLGESVVFNNEKALLYNLVVVKDPSTNLFGVNSLTDGNTIITSRYNSVEFIEGINDFIVKSENNKYGIIGNDGITKVKPAYDEIKEIDKDQGLYLVTSNNKQGVINQNGKIIVYQDYETVGLDGNTSDPNVTNRYLLYGNLIPVKLNNKWGLIDINGNTVLQLEYDGIGCKLDSAKSNSLGVVLIPDLNGIVVQKDQVSGVNGNSVTTVKKYGIVDKTGTGIVNYVADECYATTTAGKTTYYITVNNERIDIVNYYYENRNAQPQQNVEENNETNTENIENTENVDNQVIEEFLNEIGLNEIN